MRNIMFLKILIISLLFNNLFAMNLKKQESNSGTIINKECAKDSNAIIKGEILNRKEIWDRRSNPLMGRPDILKEIIYTVKIVAVLEGKSIKNGETISISVKGRELLLSFRALKIKECGIFYLSGESPPYTLIDFQSTYTPPVPVKENIVKPVAVRASDKNKRECYDPNKEYTDKELETFLEPITVIHPKYILESKEFQQRVIKIIAEKYNMKDAALIKMTSFSGPRPPKGGYKYWGIKGKITGTWHVWQSGKIRKGENLINPKRYQK